MLAMYLLRLYNGEPLDLVNLVLTTTWYTFNSQFYQQTDGVAMGGPASSTTAEIYMQAHESTAISTALHPPKVWERFVDDFWRKSGEKPKGS